MLIELWAVTVPEGDWIKVVAEIFLRVSAGCMQMRRVSWRPFDSFILFFGLLAGKLDFGKRKKKKKRINNNNNNNNNNNKRKKKETMCFV